MKKIVYLNSEIEGYKSYMALELDDEDRRIDHYPCDADGKRKPRQAERTEPDHPTLLPNGLWRIPYRREEDKRIMTLTKDLTFMSDRSVFDEMMRSMTPSRKEEIAVALGAQANEHYKHEVQELARQLLDFDKPCQFEGCQELREEYMESLELAGGDQCPDCVLRSLNAQFEAKARDIIRARTKEAEESLDTDS